MATEIEVPKAAIDLPPTVTEKWVRSVGGDWDPSPDKRAEVLGDAFKRLEKAGKSEDFDPSKYSSMFVKMARDMGIVPQKANGSAEPKKKSAKGEEKGEKSEKGKDKAVTTKAVEGSVEKVEAAISAIVTTFKGVDANTVMGNLKMGREYLNLSRSYGTHGILDAKTKKRVKMDSDPRVKELYDVVSRSHLQRYGRMFTGLATEGKLGEDVVNALKEVGPARCTELMSWPNPREALIKGIKVGDKFKKADEFTVAELKKLKQKLFSNAKPGKGKRGPTVGIKSLLKSSNRLTEVFAEIRGKSVDEAEIRKSKTEFVAFRETLHKLVEFVDRQHSQFFGGKGSDKPAKKGK